MTEPMESETILGCEVTACFMRSKRPSPLLRFCLGAGVGAVRSVSWVLCYLFNEENEKTPDLDSSLPRASKCGFVGANASNARAG